jgi:uncharacterized glyoxalase superfamily protein PhnB
MHASPPRDRIDASLGAASHDSKGFPMSDIIPGLRYRDAPAALKWLAAAFGFEERLVVPGPDGTIAHAEMSFGDGFIMLGSAKGDVPTVNAAWALSEVTRSIYIVLEDTDAHYARAKAAGAEIVRELGDTEYGSRDYIARDPEGNVWCFGTYRPGGCAV